MALFLTLHGFACSGVNQDPPSGEAGASASGGASAIQSSSSNSSGGPPSSGGSTATGGASVGGVAASNGGAAAPGSAGAGGGGGARSCDDFVACGCGCCVPAVNPPSRCYYPEVSGDLEAVVAADRAASESPNCASAGCSTGTRYACCESLGPHLTPATYSSNVTMGAYDRVHVSKQSAESCERIVLIAPGPITPRIRTALQLPLGWQWDLATHGPCSQSAIVDTGIGAIGSIALRPQGSGCALDVHLTAFFVEGGVVTPVRFDADGLVVDSLGPAACN